MMPYIFISYSHSQEDKKVVSEFVKRLRQAGIDYFIDEESIGYGENIHASVEEALKKASHVVAFLSPGSETSQWVFFEMGIAYSYHKTIVLRLLHSKMKVPPFLINAKYMSTVTDEEKFIKQLNLESKVRIGKLIEKDIDNKWGKIKEDENHGFPFFFEPEQLVPPLKMEDLHIGDELRFKHAYTRARSRRACNIKRRMKN